MGGFLIGILVRGTISEWYIREQGMTDITSFALASHSVFVPINAFDCIFLTLVSAAVV